MSEDETRAAPRPDQFPVPLGMALAGRHPAAAEFLSQLIAERDRLPPQRDKRRAPIGHALHSYDSTARHAVRRIPPGYRKTLVI
jgi:hypothetical protein